MSTLIQKAITYFTTQVPTLLGKFALGAAIFIILSLIIKQIVKRAQQKIEGNDLVNDEYSKKNAKLVGTFLFIILNVFNILATFQVIGFDVAIIMGGISLSLGFAMENTIGNMISGIFILTNKKIKLGEFIQFLGPVNIMGTVEEINIRYSVIRTFDKRRTIIPNSLIAKAPIKTMKSEPVVKGEVVFRVPRHSVIPQIKQIFTSVINSHKSIIYPEYTSIGISGFDNAGINIKGFFFVNPGKKSPVLVSRDLKGKLFEELKRYGIKPSYQHLVITAEE